MKKKIFLPVAATMIAIAIFTGGAVMAQGPGADGTGVVQSFAARVAAILNLPETDVQNAMDQAQTDMRDEAIKSRLDAMVTQGQLTQPQADQYYQWYQARPQGLQGFGGPGFGFEFRGHGRGHGRGPWGGMNDSEDMPGTPPATAPSQSTAPSGTGTSF